jgi:branched-chain amino acid transport system substrate-binding protein
VLLAVSCSDTNSKAGSTSSGKSTTSTAAKCPGQPLKFTTMASLTGGPTGSISMAQARTGIDAALAEVNGKCTLGRPLEVSICDDKFDVNGSLACGRKAASDGSLAILSSVGSFDDGATASGLPGIFLLGTGAFDLTNKNAYSSISGVTIGIGGVTAAKAAGAKSLLLVLPDTPALEFVSTQVEVAGKQLGVKVDTIHIPVDTTDFAPVAAQISERHPEAVGLLPTAPVPMINALAAAGITPKNHIMSIASIVMTPAIVKQLGSALDGMLVVGETMPPTETKNPGIAEFRDALKATGDNPDEPTVQFTTVSSWSDIKKLEGALLAAGPSVVASLDSKSLVDAVVAHPIDRPEAAPYDFSKNQLPELPGLATFRIFTRKVVIFKMEHGKYQPLSNGFIDVLHPPSLK